MQIRVAATVAQTLAAPVAECGFYSSIESCQECEITPSQLSDGGNAQSQVEALQLIQSSELPRMEVSDHTRGWFYDADYGSSVMQTEHAVDCDLLAPNAVRSILDVCNTSAKQFQQRMGLAKPPGIV